MSWFCECVFTINAANLKILQRDRKIISVLQIYNTLAKYPKKANHTGSQEV